MTSIALLSLHSSMQHDAGSAGWDTLESRYLTCRWPCREGTFESNSFKNTNILRPHHRQITHLIRVGNLITNNHDPFSYSVLRVFLAIHSHTLTPSSSPYGVIRLGSRGNHADFRMLGKPKKSMTTRSSPMPPPPWGWDPWRKELT